MSWTTITPQTDPNFTSHGRRLSVTEVLPNVSETTRGRAEHIVRTENQRLPFLKLRNLLIGKKKLMKFLFEFFFVEEVAHRIRDGDSLTWHLSPFQWYTPINSIADYPLGTMPTLT